MSRVRNALRKFSDEWEGNALLSKIDPRDMSNALTETMPGQAQFGVPVLGDIAGLAADADMYLRDPESRRWYNYLLSAVGALSPLAGAAGTKAIFAGPLAKTADISALERAKAMVKVGVPDDRIWRETGWWVNTPDGVPRFEIDDSVAKYAPGHELSRLAQEHGDNIGQWEDAGILKSHMEKSGQSVGEAKEWFKSLFGRDPHPLAGQHAKFGSKDEIVAQAKRYSAEKEPSWRNFSTTTERVLDHPGLYAAEPRLGGTPFRSASPGELGLGTGGQWEGMNSGMAIRDDLVPAMESGKSITLHELQHGVQESSGMARGGSPELFPEMAKQEALFQRDALNYAKELRAMRKKFPPGTDLNTLENAVREAYEKADILDWLPSETARDLGRQPFMVYPELYPDAAGRIEKNVAQWGLDKATTPRSPDAMYRRLAGEAEARAVQQRLPMDATQRRATPPWQSYDVPINELIIRR